MQYLCSTIRLALLSSMFGAIALSSAASAQTNLPTSTSEPIQFAQPASTEVKILAPQATSTGEQTTNLIVQYASGATVQVTVNGNPLGAQIPPRFSLTVLEASLTRSGTAFRSSWGRTF